MRLVSTRAAPGSRRVGLREALLEGLAPDGGLYVPEGLEPWDPKAVERLRGGSLVEVATELGAALLGDEMPREAWADIAAAALDFPVPLVRLSDELHVLELFHGPTLAFKDIGARVMARLLAWFHGKDDPLTVLVATSGDTGGAVARAFHGVAGTRVMVIYPDGQVTAVQEAQFATLGGNVTAVAVAGTFDDCQRLVKEALASPTLRARACLTTANSINIGRLLPQVFYHAWAALEAGDRPPVVSVPSGNLGNLAAGLLAWRLGFPLRKFIAPTTVNDALPRYLATGRFEPRPSRRTLASAMDVGRPGNFERVCWLVGHDPTRLAGTVAARAFTDADVRRAIRELDERHGYVCDPHTAIGYLGASAAFGDHAPRVVLATAHPAKFREVVEPIIGRPVPLPPGLAEALARPRRTVRIQPTLEALAELV